MILANELRIGNKIFANGLHEGKIMTVNGIDNSTLINNRVILFLEHAVGEFAKDCDPIPLTPEILEKCGFWIGAGNNYYGPSMMPHSDAFFIYDKNKLSCWASDGGDTSIIRDEIKYLHQLQNLFFAITGEELTYNV